MSVHTSKKYKNALGSKVIIALVLACVAVLLSLYLTRISFRQVLTTVNTLSEPNPKLQLVNKLFRNVVKLDQLQRLQALDAAGSTYNPFFKESDEIKLMLDTLHHMSKGDSTQLVLIDSMRHILTERDDIFLNYLNLRSEFINNDTLTSQINSLSRSIKQEVRNSDEHLISAQQKITTTTVEDVDTIESPKKKKFWNKLLGRNKTPQYIERKRLIQEQLNIQIDTLAAAKEDSLLNQLTRAISIAEINRSSTRNTLINRQILLNRTGNKLLSQLLAILHNLEMEELVRTENNNLEATQIVNNSLSSMNTIIIVFIFALAVLAFLIFADLSNSNRYRKALIAAKEEAEELGHVKHRFLANMSHELRTPLQSIVGIAEQLHLKGNAEPTEINIVYRSSQHLLQIVNQVLDYSHVISGNFRLESKRFSVKTVADEIKETMSITAAQKGLRFVYDADLQTDGMHMGDPFRLKQVLYNLLANAIKFTSEGSISFTVSQKDHTYQSTFTFSVKDTGVGIAQEDKDRIFAQFEQGDTTDGNYEGTGLGLSIVKSLIESQNGTIEVDSTPGQGSEFKVTLAYTKARGESKPEVIVQKGQSTDQEVWIVDDDSFILQVCDSILTRHNVPHHCFSSATDVLSLSQVQYPAVVFLDIRMPVMSGIELLQQLKTRLPTTTRFYALTAQALPGDKDEILQKGFDGLLIKPFVEQDLFQILNSLPKENKQVQTGENVSVLQRMVHGDETLLKKILDSFAKETQSDIDALEDSMNKAEPAKAADCLHRLAGRLGQMGYKQLALDIRHAELLIRNDQWEDSRQVLNNLIDNIRDTMQKAMALSSQEDSFTVPT